MAHYKWKAYMPQWEWGGEWLLVVELQLHGASGLSHGCIVITMWIWATLYQFAYI